jgi:hypothetical protein
VLACPLVPLDGRHVFEPRRQTRHRVDAAGQSVRLDALAGGVVERPVGPAALEHAGDRFVVGVDRVAGSRSCADPSTTHFSEYLVPQAHDA